MNKFPTKSFLFLLSLFLLIIVRTYYAEVEPNNTYSQATSLSLNATDIGALNEATQSLTADNYDWWKVILPADGRLYFETNSDAGLDIDLTIYDSNGSSYLSYGNTRSSTKEIAFNNNLMAGTYYVLVTRYTGTGAYTIRSEFTQTSLANDTEPNDTYSQGITLLPNSTTTGHLGFFNAAKTDYYDYWKVVLPDDGVLSIETTSDATLDIDLTIYDSNGSSYLAYGTTRGSTTEKASDHLMAGTYYVQASRYTGYGSYTIKSVFTKAVLDDDAEPNDVYTQALNLAPNSTDTGHLGFYNAGKTDYYDYWKVTIPSDGKLSIETNSDATLDVDLTIYDINGNSYLSYGTTRNNSKETAFVNNLMPGTYFIQAYRYTGYGSYEIKSVFTPTAYTNDVEPNDQISQAKTIVPNTLMTGHLGFYSNGFTDDQDYYVITLPTNWDSLYVRTDSDLSLDLDLALYLNSSSLLQYVYLRSNTKEVLGYKNALASIPYYIKVIKYSGYGSYGIKVSNTYPRNPVTSVKIDDPRKEIPTEFSLYQNYPNPFNPSTNIKYALPQNSFVSIKVYDMLGREVKTLVSSELSAGNHSVVWKGDDNNGHSVSSGTYIYRIHAGNFVQTKKMILMK